MLAPDNSAAVTTLRVRIFVDFWNFDISIRQRGFYDEGYKVDWRSLGPGLARLAGEIVNPAALAVYQGMNVYGSYDPNSDKDAGLRRWMANTVGKFPGVSVFDSETWQGIPYLPILSHRSAFLPIAGMWRRSAWHRGKRRRHAHCY